jgi:hypothetical protein
MTRSVAVIQLSNPARTLATEANAAETKAALRDLGYTSTSSTLARVSSIDCRQLRRPSPRRREWWLW